MKRSICVLVFVVFWVASALGQEAVSVSQADLAALAGNWKGSLTYLDYGTNKKTSIKSDLKVGPVEGEGRAWAFDYVYPDEPKANGKSVVRLSADGRMFNDQAVVAKEKLADGALRIVTTKDGTDNDKKALFRYTYLIGPSKFSILKEVKVEGSDVFFERNTYSWTR